MDTGVVFDHSHFEEDGVVWPFLGFVVGHVIGIALVVSSDR